MKVLSIICIVLLAVCCVDKEKPDSQELESSIHLFNKAFELGDTVLLAEMITEDYIHTNGAWKSFGRNRWLSYMSSRSKKISSGQLKIDSYQMTELNIQMHGSSAFVTARITSRGQEDETPFNKSFRLTNLWVYNGSRWLRAGFHDTIID